MWAFGVLFLLVLLLVGFAVVVFTVVLAIVAIIGLLRDRPSLRIAVTCVVMAVLLGAFGGLALHRWATPALGSSQTTADWQYFGVSLIVAAMHGLLGTLHFIAIRNQSLRGVQPRQDHRPDGLGKKA